MSNETTQPREIDIEIESACELSAHKIAPLFQLFGWTYAGSDNIPDIWKLQKDIYETFERLRDYAAEHPEDNDYLMGLDFGRISILRRQSEEGSTYDYEICLSLGHILGLPE